MNSLVVMLHHEIVNTLYASWRNDQPFDACDMRGTNARQVLRTKTSCAFPHKSLCANPKAAGVSDEQRQCWEAGKKFDISSRKYDLDEPGRLWVFQTLPVLVFEA